MTCIHADWDAIGRLDAILDEAIAVRVCEYRWVDHLALLNVAGMLQR